MWWKVHAKTLHVIVAGIGGINTGSPLAYLLRDQLIPAKEVDDDANDHADLGHSLIACHFIIHGDQLELKVKDLEKAGPWKKVSNFSTNNTALFDHLKTCFEGTNW